MKRQRHPLDTFTRYVYLNLWAFLLLAGAAGVALMPLWRISLWLLIPQAAAVMIQLKGGIGILTTWDDKRRKYTVLMERNSRELRADTFSEYMQAPCGRLLVKVVLSDLGMAARYAELRKLRQSFWRCRKKDFETPKAVIRFHNQQIR